MTHSTIITLFTADQHQFSHYQTKQEVCAPTPTQVMQRADSPWRRVNEIHRTSQAHVVTMTHAGPQHPHLRL